MGFITSAASKGGFWGTLGIILALLLVGFKTFFVIVHQGQIAVRVWRGRPSRRGDILAPISDGSRWVLRHLKVPGMEPIDRVLGPQKIKHSGVAFRIPGLGMIKVLSTMDKRNALDEAGFTLPQDGSDHGIPWEVMGDIIWHIRPDTQEVINAMFNADELSEIVISTVSSSIGTVYEQGRVPRGDYRNNKLVYAKVVEDCRDELLEYGVSLKRIKIRNVREIPVQIRESGLRGIGVEIATAIASGVMPAGR